MTVHPRLQQPTLESPARRGHGFTMALALTVLAAGFAYAMPRTLLTNAEEDPQLAELVVSPTGSTHTSTATTPKPKKTSDGTDEDGTERAENHGAAVSTAAHCDLDGKAHGEFVRSIAHDKDATVAEVEAACAAAQAAATTADGPDDVTHGRDHAKLPKARLDGSADGDDADDESDDDESDDSEDEASAGSAADDDDAGDGGPPEHAKAAKDKP